MSANDQLLPQEARRWTRVGLLAALSLLLSYVETFVPIPIPGVKLGLANIAVLASLALGDVAGACSVAAIKVLAAGLLFGSPLTMAYSLVGTTLSLVGMVPLSRLKTMHLAMVSVIGALLHEVGQLAVASALLGTNAVWYASTVMFVAGCITGLLCGLLATQVVEALPTDGQMCAPAPPTPQPLTPQQKTVCLVALLGLTLLVATLFRIENLIVLAVIAAALALVDVRGFIRAFVPMLPLVLLTLVLQLFISPQLALAETARAAARLATIAAASRLTMRFVPTDDLYSTLYWLLGPLRQLGVRTQGFSLAFAEAVRLLPLVSEVVRARITNTQGRLRLADLKDLLPQLVADLYAQAYGIADTTASLSTLHASGQTHQPKEDHHA